MYVLVAPRVIAKLFIAVSVLSIIVVLVLSTLYPGRTSTLYPGRTTPHIGLHIEHNAFIVDTDGCKIPNIDPFDVSVSHLVNTSETVLCNGTAAMTYIDRQYLRINRTALMLYYNDVLEYCEYQYITRPDLPSDDVFHYEPVVRFSDDVRVTSEFLRVACYGQQGGLLYVNFHAFILVRPQLERQRRQQQRDFVTSRRPLHMFNLLVLGVDSVSRLNFLRHMPLTRRYLVQHLRAVELMGYNKVADNTYVNLVPMFAGKYVEELPWDERMSDVPFDNYSFIWNDFSSRGYRTLYAEDAPKIAIFNYNKAGFHRPPADYYLRPFSLALEDHGAMWSGDHDCVGPRLETDVVLDWIARFVQTFVDVPYLAFGFLTRLTHEYVNKAAAADTSYERFFRVLHTSGLLNNTVVLFYSDHGMRFGDIRQTYIGKLEERLPFMYVVLPPVFDAVYPQMLTSLRVNAHRLTTPFDIYETLKTFLDFTTDSVTNNDVTKRGLNLLAEIPVQRTCVHAAILPHWCTCHVMTVVSVHDRTVLRLASSVVRYINNAVRVHGPRCARLALDVITDARYVTLNHDVIHFKKSLHDVIGRTVLYETNHSSDFREYLLTIRTRPGGGLFEATVRYDRASIVDHVTDVSRINRYADQSVCIEYHTHKKYCYCIGSKR